MTPKAFAAFQERDRGLADQFHNLTITPTNEADTLRILLQVRRRLEADSGCRFEPDALPTVCEVTRRYEGEAAFPGKAVGLLKHLSAHHPKADIDRDVVYREFHSKTGLSLLLLDKRRRLPREAVVDGLRQEIVGQVEAIDAAADVITVAKAGFNDPQQPWATLLFLGPTGVGKTQCAKTLTKVLFTDESRLLRFDMNEFVGPDSAARLVGTASDPEGLLTGAVRRQPYSVVLFDEIEKAQPDVFDLLLQLIGEGRLTDAIGRTSDFCNTVVVMTSNLGVRESGRSLGLRSDEASRRQTFVKAAEQFFRPEFFNRIDRVVPFEELSRQDMQKIAELLLSDLLKREGLVRRQSVLQVDERAMRRIVDEGYHPQLGARALKRAIEKQLTQPIAAHLTAASPTAPAVIDVYCGPEDVLAAVNVLKPAGPVVAEVDDPATVVERSERLLDWLDEKFAASQTRTDIQADHISPQQLRYFALKEQTHIVRELVVAVKRQLKEGRHQAIRPKIGLPVRDVSHQEIALLQWSRSGHPSQKRFHREIQAAEEINDFVRESAEMASTPISEFQQLVVTLRRQAGWLWEMWQARDKPERIVLLIRNNQSKQIRNGMVRLRNTYAVLFEAELSFEQKRIECDESGLSALYLAGPFVWPLAKLEEGVHLQRSDQGNLTVFQVSVLPIDDGDDAEATLQRHLRRRADWLDVLATGTSSLAENPWPLDQLVRISGRETRDLRSGLTSGAFPSWQERIDFLFAGFAPPTSLEDVE